VDIYASNDEVVFAVEVPRVGKGDVKIQIDETDTLVIQAMNTFKEPEGASMRQYRVGDYYRAFKISDGYDKEKVQATIENGLLQITIQKKNPQNRKE
jgi:HSP20 family molecular chaperone IbpA